MFIFLEGPDGVGKTCLANELLEYGYQIAKYPERQSDKNTERRLWLEFYDSNSNKNLIFDRSVLSELVYRLFDTEKTYIVPSDLDTYFYHSKIILLKSSSAFDDAMKRGEDNITDRNLHRDITTVYDVLCQYFSRFYRVPLMKYNRRLNAIKDVIYFINNNC